MTAIACRGIGIADSETATAPRTFGPLALLVLQPHAHRRWLPGGGVHDPHGQRGLSAHLRKLHERAREQARQHQPYHRLIAHSEAVYMSRVRAAKRMHKAEPYAT